jgi:phosphoribosylformylglycinamidine synthase subunit PurL
MVDSVTNAQQTPDTDQPWQQLGLKADEYQRIKDILNRRPTSAELAMYSVMWSEHCSYKSSKVHLKQFGEKTPDNDVLLVGIGENAGVVDIGDNWAVTFKVESHNHPSFIEPYQGAATGVGGIVRDILAMGARPLAVMDSLRFGDPKAADTARVLNGVVAGVGGYGNSLGLPNIGGETVFHSSYAGNPLVNALCVGAMKHDQILTSGAEEVGDLVLLYGAATGGDGIGGVSVLASEVFDQSAQAARPSVQVGDPFMEKLLIEATLEMARAGLIEAIQDLGGAGLSCATSEMASNGSGGMRVQLDQVPLRDASLSPEEILMSESQERMCAIIDPANLDQVLAICEKWDLSTTVIGEVTDTNRLEIYWHDELIVDVPPRTVAHEGPVYNRLMQRPTDQDQLIANTTAKLTKSTSGEELKADLITLISHANMADKSWITEQYDKYVRGDTVLSAPDDAGMIRIDRKTGKGVAISLDGNSRYCKLDPYRGAQLNLAEAYRNVAMSGAKPIAVTNCLNFGSPEDPGVMWQFAEAVAGLADAALEFGTPVTGGNVSFYNQTGDTAILPTPVIGVLGVIDEVGKRITRSYSTSGSKVYLLGETKAELDGSVWAEVLHNHLGGVPPQLDINAEKVLARCMRNFAAYGIAEAAHDLADGGLAIALAELVYDSGIGMRITLAEELTPAELLFSESASRAIVVVPELGDNAFNQLCEQLEQKVTLLGEIDEEVDGLEIAGLFNISYSELTSTFQTPLLPKS